MDNRNKLKVWLQQHHLTQKDWLNSFSRQQAGPVLSGAVKSPVMPTGKKQRPALPGLGDSGTQSHG